MSHFTSQLRPKCASLVALVATGLLATSASADSVRLFVQTPYDFETGEWDLDRLDERAPTAVLAENLNIPYGRIEALVRDKLEAALQPRGGTVVCEGDTGVGVLDDIGDELCPDVHWSISFSHEFGFPSQGQPVLTPFGQPQDNGVRVTADGQARLMITPHIHVEVGIHPDIDLDLPIEVLFGLHASVAIKLYPVLDYQDVDMRVKRDWSNVDITGLDEIAIEDGGVIGAGVSYALGGSPLVGGILGAIVGAEGADVARDQVRDLINAKLNEAINYVNDTIAANSGSFKPQFATANHILDSIRNQPVPGVNRSLRQLGNLLGLSVDVRSVTQDQAFTAAVTARFANNPGTGSVAGELRFPKTACHYEQIGSRELGHHTVKSIEARNEDLGGLDCRSVVGDQLGASVYYGADPERALQSGNPANQLIRWGAFGRVDVIDEPLLDVGDAFVCHYAVSGLPAAAIAELAPGQGSELEARLWNGNLAYSREPDLRDVRRRIFTLSTRSALGLGSTQAFDHVGVPLASEQLGLGGRGPSSVDDCPDVGGDDSGGVQPPGGIPSPPNEGNCDFCGQLEDPGEQVFDPGYMPDISERPVQLPPIRQRQMQR